MKKILIALLVFIASLAALSFIKNNQGGFTLLPDLPGTQDKEPSKPISGTSGTDSPFQENPILEAKIDGIELLEIKSHVSLKTDGTNELNAMVVYLTINNVQGLDASERSFLAVNKESGQRFAATPSNFSDGYTSPGSTQQVPVAQLGCEKVSVVHFGETPLDQLKIPDYGNYDITFTFGFDGSKTKISITKSFNLSYRGLSPYTEGSGGGFFS